MANFSEVGINFNAFTNTTGLSFNFSNMTKAEFIDYIPANANSMTNDYYGIVVLSVLLIFLIWLFSDISQYGLFRYSSVRALGIGLGMVLTIGLMMLSIGYMTNYIHISTLGAVYIAMLSYVVISNPS